MLTVSSEYDGDNESTATSIVKLLCIALSKMDLKPEALSRFSVLVVSTELVADQDENVMATKVRELFPNMDII